MKENIIDVLVFLFDNYLILEEEIPSNEATLSCELEEAGFEPGEINQAFDWLGALEDVKEGVTAFNLESKNSFRVYSTQEEYKLDSQCRGFLLNLEQMALLDPQTREIIIDRVMAIEASPLTLMQFKRIVGLVMLNKAQHKLQQDEILIWFEGLLEDERPYELQLH